MNKNMVILSEMIIVDEEFLKGFFEDRGFIVYTQKIDSETNTQADKTLGDKIANSRIVIFWNIQSIDNYKDFITTILKKPDVRIIAVSNYPNIDEAHKCLILGMRDYIIAPKYTELLKIMEELVIYQSASQ